MQAGQGKGGEEITHVEIFKKRIKWAWKEMPGGQEKDGFDTPSDAIKNWQKLNHSLPIYVKD